MEICVGKILTISELNVQILLNEEKVKYHDILFANYKGKEILFEVAEEDGHIVSAVPFQSVIGLKKGMEVYKKDSTLKMQYNDEILGKVFDSYGNTIDGTTIENVVTKDVYGRNL